MPVTGSNDTYRPAGRRRHKKKHGATGFKIGQPNSTAVLGPQPIETVLPGGPVSSGPQPFKPAPQPKAPVQPLDPAVVNQQIIGQRDVALGDLYSTWQQGNLDQQYGFGAAGASNPYSEAAKLQENLKRSVLGTTGDYASQGQYNSGAYGRAQNENARNYDIGYDSARRSYDQASGNLQFDRLRNYANAGTGVDNAKFQSLIDALRGL